MTMMKSRSVLLNSLRNYRFHSIFIKNLLLVMCVNMLPVFGVLVVSYYSYRQIQQSENEAYSRELYTRISKEVDNIFNGFKDKMMILAFDDKTDYFYLQKKVEYINPREVVEIIDMISTYNVAIECLEETYVYATANQMVVCADGYYNYEKFEDKIVLDQWSASKEYFHAMYVNREKGGKQQQNVCVYYITHYSKDRKGIIVFLIDMKALAEALDYGDNVRLMIANDTQVVFDSAGEYSGAEAAVIEEFSDIQGETGGVYSGVLKESGLGVLLQVEEHPVNDKVRNIKGIMLSFFVFMFITTVGLVFYISRKIFDPFHEIMSALKADVSQVNERNLLKNINEVNYIKQTIYATISSKQDVEEELAKRIHLLKKAQAVALQAQIEPHFVNNALENINQRMVMNMGKNNELSQMMSALSSLLVASLCNTDTFITLGEEIEYVQQYLLIQSKLLGDRFDIDMQIPEELKECKLIKLILQPVVENAIKYGIKPYSGRGRLCVRATRQADVLCVDVQDSGLGLTEEEAAEINDSIRKTVIKESKHLGLSNVNQRIILAFGEEYGVTMKSRIGIGTTVEVRAPYQK